MAIFVKDPPDAFGRPSYDATDFCYVLLYYHTKSLAHSLKITEIWLLE